MELSDKILALRKQCGWTQEQFAEKLFVTRTAVSKWETGRGVPSMESLKMIAGICGVTLDDLLCSEELFKVAKEENRKNLGRHAFLFDGVLNLTAVLGLLLPIYKMRMNDVFVSVPLANFDGWLSACYWLFSLSFVFLGILQTIVFRGDARVLKKLLLIFGFVLSVCAVLVCILSSQPYPAVLYFALFLLKGGLFLLYRD